MTIGGVRYKGTTLRSLLGLRSTMFTVAVEQGKIVVRMKGYGHRVGMSQYGADAMALSGSSYREILAHYYVGAILEQFPLTDG
jgi:stage II sporulation protein D